MHKKGDNKMKFTKEQWRLYKYLKDPDNSEDYFWVQKNFPPAGSSTLKFARCPLCGYETDVTNIHRNCPLAPLRTNSDFRFPNLAVYNKLASLNMVDVKGEGKQKTGFVPRGWDELQWKRDITPDEWDKIIEKQDFVNLEETEK